MRCSVNIANLGDFADPRVVAEVARLADAGATWWDERFPFNQLARAAAVRARIEQGPPRIT